MESNNYFLGRQPILDTDQQIFAYELLFRSGTQNSASIEDNVSATSRVLFNSLNHIGVQKLLGNKLGFINANEEVLKKGFLRSLPKENFIIEILEYTKLDEEVLKIIDQMRDEGYVFALDDFTFEVDFIRYFEPLFSRISYVKVDLMTNTKEKVVDRIKIFKNYKVKFLAEKVENIEDFKFYKRMGFDLFQGYFFSKPTVIEGKGIDPSKMPVVELINMIYRDADIQKLETQFKMYPDLTINLLQFINSAAIASRSKIISVRQALAMLGQKQLLNWLILMAYASPTEGQNSPLLFNALERAKMMELLIKKTSHDQSLQEEAFLTGLLSLLDALFQVPIEQVLEKLNISQEIKDAILKQSNLLGKFLRMVKISEGEHPEEVQPILDEIKLNPDDFNEISLEGLCWAQSNGKQMCS